jgi:TonB-dependent starch-binding outer membrane protein SusC
LHCYVAFNSFLQLNVYGQQMVTVSGTVTDAQGQPLPGATVVEEGTTNGTVTNNDGVYTINVPGNATLVFSFVGMRTQRVAVNSRTQIDIQMEEETVGLDEVVAIGYGTQSRRRISSAIASVDTEAIQDQTSPNLDNLLQGKAAGVHVIQNNGAPGAGITIRIRGNTSIGGGNSPLYVIDGVPIKSGDYSGLYDGSNSGATSNLSALADINTSDIESIEILKDAAASSIYGSRASNGVILITTKKGMIGEMKINVDFQSGFQKIARILPVVNAQQDRELGYEAWVNNGRIDAFEHFTDWYNPNYNHDTHWQEELFQTAPINNSTLRAEGGTKELSYSASLGYLQQEGIIPNSDFTRYSSRVNLLFNKNERIIFGANLSYARSINNRIADGDVGAGTGSGSFRGILNNLFEFQSPMLSPYDIDGNLTYGFNPIGIAKVTTNEALSNRVIGNFYGELEITEGLKLRSSIGIDLLGMHENRFFPSVIATKASEYRQSTARFFEDITWINENIVSYEKAFNEKHNFTAIIGYSQQESVSETILAQRTNASSDNIITVNAGATLSDATSHITSWAINSLFSRINYSYQDKYLVQLALRRDGSSRFGKNTRYGNFPSASLAWRVSDESFMKNANTINDLKFRISAGQTGNQSIGNYVARGLMATGADYEGEAGITHSTSGLPNRDLTWEKTNQFNFGFDMSILNNKLTFIADYYYKKTTDLLFGIPIPTTSGYTSLTTNLGALENKGIEFSTIANVIDKNLKWDLNFNISLNRSKVLELPSGNDVPVWNGISGIVREDEPLGIFYGYIFDGVFSRSEDIPVGLRMNGRLATAGDAIFRDLNNDNVIDLNDRTIIGDPNPDFVGGMTHSFAYNNFELSAFFNFSYGNDILNSFRAKRDDMARAFPVPSPNIYYNRWQKEGDVTDVPIAQQGDPKLNGRDESTRWLEDGSYLRLKTITLAYNIPRKFIDRFNLSKVRLYITGQNLLTFTNYSGYDPEVTRSSNYSRGIFGVDTGGYPTAKSFVLGINLGF